MADNFIHETSPAGLQQLADNVKALEFAAATAIDHGPVIAGLEAMIANLAGRVIALEEANSAG